MLFKDTLSPELYQLATFIKDKHHFDFTNYAESSFKRRIDRIIELYKIKDTTTLIKKISDGTFEINKLIEEITVNTTEMFRDSTVWLHLRENVLPQLNKYDTIRIWHAGCSSGEEVYSMAILLKELGLYNKAKITATDLDTTVIKKAQAGVYATKQIELNSENYYRAGGSKQFTDYYSVENDKMVMDKSLLEKVNFKKHDLVTGEAFSKFDIILCRNVMIYFNKTLQDNVIELFSKSMFKDGFLVIGNKETLVLSKHFDKFNTITEKEKIYQIKR